MPDPMPRPLICYHGRRDLVDIILPEKANGVDINQQLCAVYTTPNIYMAEFFSIILDPVPPVPHKGYVYRINLDGLIYIGNEEYISLESVIPISYEIIYPLDYFNDVLNGFWSGSKCFGVKYYIKEHKDRYSPGDIYECAIEMGIDLKTESLEDMHLIADKLLTKGSEERR